LPKVESSAVELSRDVADETPSAADFLVLMSITVVRIN